MNQQNVNQNFEREQYDILRHVYRFFGAETSPTSFAEFNGQQLKKQSSILDTFSKFNVILCGGAITSVFTGLPVKDLDFYVPTLEAEKEVDTFLRTYFPTVFESNNAITYKRASGSGALIYTIQLIKRFKGGPQDIFKNFDFTITQGCYQFSEKSFVFSPRFFSDLSKRRLVYCGASHFPICALYRTLKYQKKGFIVTGGTLMHIALAIAQLEIKNYRELREQLQGIDTLFLSDIIGHKGWFKDEVAVDYAEFIEKAFEAINKYSVEANDDDQGE